MKRLICRVFGHRWIWVSGWINYECARCGMTDDEERASR